MEILEHDLHLYDLHHHHVGDRLGSLQHRELLDEYRASE
jgi:hypothetical protein